MTATRLSIIVLLGVFAFSFWGGQTADAQRPVKRRKAVRKSRPQLRENSRLTIRRTNLAIRKGKRHLRRHENYTGHLRRAVAHQRYAIVLHRRGFYRKAQNHSIRARRLAFVTIAKNRGGKPSSDIEFTQDEIYEAGTTDESLDKDLEGSGVDIPKDDKAALDEELPDVD